MTSLLECMSNVERQILNCERCYFRFQDMLNILDSENYNLLKKRYFSYRASLIASKPELNTILENLTTADIGVEGIIFDSISLTVLIEGKYGLDSLEEDIRTLIINKIHEECIDKSYIDNKRVNIILMIYCIDDVWVYSLHFHELKEDVTKSYLFCRIGRLNIPSFDSAFGYKL